MFGCVPLELSSAAIRLHQPPDAVGIVPVTEAVELPQAHVKEFATTPDETVGEDVLYTLAHASLFVVADAATVAVATSDPPERITHWTFDPALNRKPMKLPNSAGVEPVGVAPSVQPT
jgi:hypothetical protein